MISIAISKWYIKLSFVGSLASSSQLRANARILNGSNVTVCPSDDYTLIFVCNATGLDIEWWFSPFIPSGSPLSLELFNQGESVPRDPVIVYITKKTMLRPPVFMIESQLHISTKSILDEQSSVVCSSDNIEAEISIKKLGKFCFSNGLAYYPFESRYSKCSL